MKCKKVERLLSSYLDNSLRFAYRDAIKEHLAKCGKCTDELNTISNLHNLLKLKVKEKPSEEYWEGYWLRLESKLHRGAAQQLSENRSSSNRFFPKFAFALNGILIALLIFLGGLLHIRTQEFEWLQSVHEKTVEQISTYLLYPATRGNALGAKTNTQFLDKYDMITYNYHSKSWLEISSDVASEGPKNGVKNTKKEG